jgi:hypothetical protein
MTPPAQHAEGRARDLQYSRAVQRQYSGSTGGLQGQYRGNTRGSTITAHVLRGFEEIRQAM